MKLHERISKSTGGYKPEDMKRLGGTWSELLNGGWRILQDGIAADFVPVDNNLDKQVDQIIQLTVRNIKWIN